jgi:acyl-CoA synthetase (AMP-forming)/AMP-acid ligase II
VFRPQTISEALVAAARDHGQRLAYVADGDAVTYGALLDDARRLAGGLAALRRAPGERVAVVLPTGLDFIRVVYAAQLAGMVPAAINPDLPLEAIGRRIRLIGARHVVCEPAALSRSRPALEPLCQVTTVRDLSQAGRPFEPLLPEPDAAAFLQFTSGTTGEPRAATIAHRSLIASLTGTAARLDLSQEDVLATWVPLHHDLGLVRYVFGALLARCPSHLVRPSMAHLHSWLRLVSDVGATITGAPDSAYRVAARTVDPERVNLRSLRFAGNGGEPVRLTTIEQFERRFGLPGIVRPAYGLAEATLTVTSTAPGEDLRIDQSGTVSCGRALEGIDLRIVDETGREMPVGSAGELIIRGLPVFDGYFDDAQATREALRDGWLHTGDIASIDRDGYLFLKGRRRVLIKRGGVAIAPREIEDAVDRVADVRRSAAIGIASESGSGTEQVVVVAEVAGGDLRVPQATERLHASISLEVMRSLGWVPSRIILVPPGTVPMTGAGKIRYDELRQMIVENNLPARELS